MATIFSRPQGASIKFLKDMRSINCDASHDPLKQIWEVACGGVVVVTVTDTAIQSDIDSVIERVSDIIKAYTSLNHETQSI